tara:strand:+ start:1180 stop:1527 length:348 start_codon:yes stop_codon:yes gene_type:complete
MTKAAKALAMFLKKNNRNLEVSLREKLNQIAKLQSKKQITERDLQRLKNLRLEARKIRQQIKTNNAKGANKVTAKPLNKPRNAEAGGPSYPTSMRKAKGGAVKKMKRGGAVKKKK